MTSVPTSFEWVRDRKRRFTLKRGVIRLDDWSTVKPHEFAVYQPLADEFAASIPAAYANIRGADGALAFVNKFGPLTWDGRTNKGEKVASILDHVDQVNEILSLAAEATKETESEQTPERWILGEILEESDAFYAERSSLWSGALTVRVIPSGSRKEKPRLVVSPKDLMGAISFMVAERLADGATFRRCPQCDDLFEAGGGVGRRKNAQFCSPEHQIEFNSDKRTKEKEL